MEDLKNKILENKPGLKDSSIKTYLSNLKRVFNEISDTKDLDYNFFIENKDLIIGYLYNLDINPRKSLLSSLVVLTNDTDYKEYLSDTLAEYDTKLKKNEKSQKEKDNWVTQEEIKTIYKKLWKNINCIYKKKDKTINDLLEIQNYVILSLLGGIHIPPRRLQDFTEFKIKNIDKEKDNYLEHTKPKASVLVFNVYKTAKSRGKEVIEIPKKLSNILNKWIKINPTQYLFFDSDKNKLSNSQLTKYINKIFSPKLVSVNILRHSYVSDYLGNIPSLDIIEKNASKMAHSLFTHLTYKKNN